jgi:hypothetical protein
MLSGTKRATPITRIVNAEEIPAPQLGRILIAAGLLSEDQLAQALEEHAQTGRRLGEIIVQRGFISGPALANALAEQHGGVLKTEYGFASGLGGVATRLSPVPEDEQAPAASEQPGAGGLDDRDELLESLRARVEAQELELAKLREQLEQERARKDVQVHVWPGEQPVPTTPGPVQAEQYLLCVPTAAGYVLLDRVGGLPSVGHAVEVPEEEGRFTVTKVVRLPRNGRPCAYLQRA